MRFAANPRPAHADIGTAVSSGCEHRFLPGFSVAGDRAPRLEHLTCSLGSGEEGKESEWRSDGTFKRLKNKQMLSLRGNRAPPRG